MEPLTRIHELGLVPVVEIPSADQALPLAEALLEGGLACAEITFRTAAGADFLERIAGAFPELLVGAGTVLTTVQVERAISAGARFVVSPGLDPAIVRRTRELGAVPLPGICTPSDIQAALALGLDTLKFFPAEAIGGARYLKALAGPFGGLRFVPTGGIEPDNLGMYLALPVVIACGGSWMVKKDLIADGDFAGIRERVAEAVALVRRLRGGET